MPRKCRNPTTCLPSQLVWGLPLHSGNMMRLHAYNLVLRTASFPRVLVMLLFHRPVLFPKLPQAVALLPGAVRNPIQAEVSLVTHAAMAWGASVLLWNQARDLRTTCLSPDEFTETGRHSVLCSRYPFSKLTILPPQCLVEEFNSGALPVCRPKRRHLATKPSRRLTLVVDAVIDAFPRRYDVCLEKRPIVNGSFRLCYSRPCFC